MYFLAFRFCIICKNSSHQSKFQVKVINKNNNNLACITNKFAGRNNQLKWRKRVYLVSGSLK